MHLPMHETGRPVYSVATHVSHAYYDASRETIDGTLGPWHDRCATYICANSPMWVNNARSFSDGCTSLHSNTARVHSRCRLL